MSRSFLVSALLLSALIGGAATTLALSVFGRDGDDSSTGRGSSVYTLRKGDVVLYPGAAARCKAVRQADQPTLWCTRIGAGRRQAIFTDTGVQVWSLACRVCAPGDPLFTSGWRPKWKAAGRTFVPGVFLGGEYGLRYRPTNVVYTGDGSSYVDRLRFRTYGGSRAVAFGVAQVNDCRPSCADGTHHPVPARVIFWRLGTCRGKRVYGMITVQHSANHEYARDRPFTIDLRYMAGCAVADFAR